MKVIKSKFHALSSLIIFAVVLMIFAVGFLPERSVTISSLSSYNAFYNGDRSSGNVGIMIGVYGGGENVEEMVKILDEAQAKATFFVGGCWADDNVEALKLIISSGHEIGNYGYFNKELKRLNDSLCYEEIYSCGKVVHSLTGYKTSLFLPPNSSYSKSTLKVAKGLGYKTVLPTKEVLNGDNLSASEIVSKATKNLKNGDFILLFPNQNTVEALNEIVSEIKQKGYGLATVSSLINNNY